LLKFNFYRNLNKNERFPSSKRHLKSVFADFESINFSFGLTRFFEFDSSVSKKPKINGTVVSSISYNRDRTINFSLFPLSITDYPDVAIDDFNNQLLVTIKQWIEAQINKTDTAILGIEELIVEWDGKEHLIHRVKFL